MAMTDLLSKVRQRPTTESACNWQMPAVVLAESMMLTPPATAALDSCSSNPARSSRAAGQTGAWQTCAVFEVYQ